MEKITKDKEIDFLQPPKTGEVIKGKVAAIGRSAVYIDLGFFGTGIIYGKEFKKTKDFLKNLNKGDEISAKIVDLDTQGGYIGLSFKEAREEIAFKKIEELKEKDDIIKVTITGANKGGLLTQLLKLPAFIPVSQLSPEHYPRIKDGDPNKILKELQNFVGEEMEVKILDFSPKDNKLILSEKAKEAEKIKDVLEKYKEGDIVEGEITAVLNFGAFVRFKKDKEKELEGLIHISELDWKLIEDPSSIVKVGEKVKAKIINIEKDRVFLSLKALKKNPWEDIDKKYKKGDTIKGEILTFKPFGALVQINPEIQGLIHISEFGSQKKMEENLELGGKHDFIISLIDPKDHKIILKLK